MSNIDYGWTLLNRESDDWYEHTTEVIQLPTGVLFKVVVAQHDRETSPAVSMQFVPDVKIKEIENIDDREYRIVVM